MKLTSSIQSLLLDIQLGPDESLADIVLDAQEYAMECILELVTAQLSVEDITTLDEMIDNDASVEEIDTWLASKVENYDTYIQQSLEMVKDYLSGEEEDETTEQSA